MSASRERLRKEVVCMHSKAFSPMYATHRSTKDRLPLLPRQEIKRLKILDLLVNT